MRAYHETCPEIVSIAVTRDIADCKKSMATAKYLIILKKYKKIFLLRLIT